MKAVTVWGDSITGLACAYLLSSENYCVQLVTSTQNTSPPILLTEEAVFLLKEIFGNLDQLNDFLLHSNRRIISTNHSETTILPDNSFSCHSSDLKKVLRQCLVSRFNRQVEISAVASYNENNLNVIADAGFRDMHVRTECATFGHRFIYSCMLADLKDQNLSTSYMEVRANSWSFNFPLKSGGRCVQLMSPQQFINFAQLGNCLKTHLKRLGTYTLSSDFKIFNGAPAVYKVTGKTKAWLVGNALSKYDPVCGNGTANYLRSVLLLSAVLKKGKNEFPSAKNYYYTRIQYGMRLHLDRCLDFYTVSFDNNCWRFNEAFIKNWIGDQLNKENAVQKYFLHLA